MVLIIDMYDKKSHDKKYICPVYPKRELYVLGGQCCLLQRGKKTCPKWLLYFKSCGKIIGNFLGNVPESYGNA